MVQLLRHQPDVLIYGRLFSYGVIYLLNVLGICLWIILVASPTLESAASNLAHNTAQIGRTLQTLTAPAGDWFSNHWKTAVKFFQ